MKKVSITRKRRKDVGHGFVWFLQFLPKANIRPRHGALPMVLYGLDIIVIFLVVVDVVVVIGGGGGGGVVVVLWWCLASTVVTGGLKLE